MMTESSPLLGKGSFVPNGVTTTTYDEKIPVKSRNDKTTRHTVTSASYSGTILNIMKTCMGTGCLALPYACQQGGIVLFVVGLVFVAIWNYIVMYLLIDCLQYIPSLPLSSTQQVEKPIQKERLQNENAIDCHGEDIDGITNTEGIEIESSSRAPLERPPTGISTMGIVAWYSFGTIGLQILDFIVVLLFLGIITAYVAAVVTFLNDTPFTTSFRWFDAIITGFIMGTIAIVPDIGYLSRASGIGLIVLFTAFLVIAGYGIVSPTVPASSSLLIPVTTSAEVTTLSSTSTSSNNLLLMWPTSISSISHYYGIAVFGYGAVPLTYNFKESMEEPNRIVPATATALTLVAMSNIALGVGLYVLFPNLTADVLHELPSSGVLPSITRLAMVGTIIATAPLLIVPCSELLEGRWVRAATSPVLGRVMVRYGIISFCVIVAVSLPDFVEVLALVGCFCVALVSFCVPPSIHLRLLCLAHMRHKKQSNENMDSIDRESFQFKYIVYDAILLVWGIFATVVSTVCILTK